MNLDELIENAIEVDGGRYVCVKELTKWLENGPLDRIIGCIETLSDLEESLTLWEEK